MSQKNIPIWKFFDRCSRRWCTIALGLIYGLMTSGDSAKGGSVTAAAHGALGPMTTPGDHSTNPARGSN